MMTQLRATLLATSTLLAWIAVPAAAQTTEATVPGTGAQAQQPAATSPDATAADADTNRGDITVTARRRNENIVDVPLAISVVTSAQIDRLNLNTTNDIANYVPGLEFSDFTPGNSRNDRGGNRLLIFRGLNLSNNGGVTGAGSVFLDGAAVIGNEIPASLDIGAVEVLRGPQSVYFGRASLAGAVSYRTKAIPDHWTADIELTGAERETYRAEASIAGPILPGLLGIRLTGLDEGNDGYITNDFEPGGTRLGARSRKSASATLEFTPAPSLEVKLYANYFHDQDGQAATANIFPDSANGTGQVTNCLRGSTVIIPPTATNPNPTALPPLATICGKVPGRNLATNYENTIIPPRDAAVLFAIPFLQGEGFDQAVGLQRNVLNTHGVINYDISDYFKFQAITGYHTTALQQVSDGIQQPVQPGALYSNYDANLANRYTDFSQEIRLSSDPARAFSWTVGANYVNARNQSTAVVTFTSNPATGTPTFTPFPQNLGDDRAKTYGFFGGAYLKLFDDRLTLSGEGRYQIDKRRTITRNAANLLLSDVSRDFKSFNPRASIDYDVGGRRKIYASYASGTRPGGFNSGFLVYLDPTNPIYTRTSPPPLDFNTVTADINNTFGPVALSYDEERLRIGELGFKGEFAGGKGYFDINSYYGILSNQQVRRSLTVLSLGFGLGAVQNTGKIEIYGVEFSGNYNFTRQLSLSSTFAWNHTNRKTYIDNSPTTVRIYGRSDFSGLELPNTPQYTGSAVLSYDDTETKGFGPFGNVAFVYRGKQWADIGNFAYIPGRATVDLRAGVGNDTLRIEGFVTNLFNNLTYPGGNVAPDFGGNAVNGVPVQYSGFYGAYAIPRTVGARLSAKF